VPNRAILAGAVHTLEDQKQRVSVGRIVKLLQGTQLSNMFFKKLSILLLRLAKGRYDRWPLIEVERLPRRYTEIF
jgi:hypothetical protein